MANGIAEGTHKASATFVLSQAAPPRERRVAFLEPTHRIGRGLRRLSTGSAAGAAARSRSRGGWRDGRGLAAVRGQRVGGRGEVRDWRAGKDVGRAGIVDVRVVDAWVVVAVCAREGDGLVGSAGLRAADADLRAGRVELGAAEGDGEVKRDDLVPDEVVARRDLRREGHGYGTAVHDVLLIPVLIWFSADLVDFEPLGGRTIELVAGRGAARGHIRHEWAGIVWPVFLTRISPVKLQDGAWVRRRDHGGELSGQSTVQVRVARAFDGTDVGDLANGTVRWFRVGDVARVGLAID